MFKPKFGVLPGHWGLAGKTREIAKAEYELEGYELERKLLEINADEYDIEGNEKKLLALDLKYKKIERSVYDRKMAEKITDEVTRAKALLELDYREGKIKELAYSKMMATLNNEPWVTVLNMDFTHKSALEGSFELDWNDHFVKKLEAEGYSGPTPDNIVNAWFMEVCRNVAMEEFDGTGDFTADSAANIETMKRWNSETLPSGRKGHK